MLAAIPYPDWLSPEVIPGLPIRWYGLMYLIAFSISYLLFVHQVRERKLQVDKDDILNFFFWAIIGLLVGARVFAALVYDTTGRYLRNPLLVFWPFDENWRFIGLQGMSYHGGLIGAILGAVIYAKIRKIDLLDWGDMLVAGIPLGYTFGRLGNFINGELFGRVTTLPWGMIFPHAQRFPASEPWVREAAREAGIAITSANQMVNLPRHPSQLYEAFFEGIVLWAVLWFIFRKRRPFKGFLIGCYIIGYGIIRFFIEYVREPDLGIGFPIKLVDIENPTYRLLSPWNFTTGQILNVLMILGGIAALLVFRHLSERRKRAGAATGEADRQVRATADARKARKRALRNAGRQHAPRERHEGKGGEEDAGSTKREGSERGSGENRGRNADRPSQEHRGEVS